MTSFAERTGTTGGFEGSAELADGVLVEFMEASTGLTAASVAGATFAAGAKSVDEAGVAGIIMGAGRDEVEVGS